MQDASPGQCSLPRAKSQQVPCTLEDPNFRQLRRIFCIRASCCVRCGRRRSAAKLSKPAAARDVG